MTWSRDNSIALSKICILAFSAAGILCAIGLPFVVEGIVRRRGWETEVLRNCFLLSAYSLMVPALIALSYLYRLLQNISRENVFVKENVSYLRKISWACYLAAIIGVLSFSYYLPFGVLAAGAGFMGLILRIVKNVFAEAVYLKEENDFTI